jgi:hypothetical protein
VENPYINKEIVSNVVPDINTNGVLSSIDTGDFIKGALIGAVATYLLTNESAQKAIFKTVAKGTELFQSGIEEMKERMEDAKAELEAKKG